MTINYLITKLVRKNVLIPLCISDKCKFIRIRNKKGIEEWTDDYDFKKLVDKSHIYKNITGTLCPKHLEEHYKRTGVYKK